MYDVIIIGSGPAGYVAAIRAGQTGLKCAIIEKDVIGGMCLNWGCIPSKAMLESVKLYQKIIKDSARFGIEGIDKSAVNFNWNTAVKRADTIVKRLTGGVEYLLKKNGVDIIHSEAKIMSSSSVLADNRLLETKNIIIATGAASPKIENSQEDLVAEPRHLFSGREIPENIVITGYGPVAFELAQLFNLTGKKVTIVSPTNFLLPKADDYLRKYMTDKLGKDKIVVVYNTEITSTNGIWNNGILTAGTTEIPCDLIVNASPRKGNIVPSDIDLDVENNFYKVNEDFETSVKGIYAAGDVNGLSHYAHIASAQGMHIINRINGIEEKLDIRKLPMNMYSVPEAAQIGFTEQEAIAEGYDYKISEFPLSANGKALTEGSSEGFVRLISDKKYGEVLGVQIVAPNATDMINEASAYMQLESTVYDIAHTVHTHPTVSEIFMEAGFEAVDHAIHK